MTERLYMIGDAARAAGVTVKSVRYYEAIGLIPRAARRASGGQGAGHRLFTAADVGRLRFIHDARALGLGVRDVRPLVAIAEEDGCPGDRPEYRRVLARHLATVGERIERLERLRGTLESLMTHQRRPAGGACHWETCKCMDASNLTATEAPSRKHDPASRRSKGEHHV